MQNLDFYYFYPQTNSCLYLNKKLKFCEMKATVNELWSRGEKVTCGVVTKDTRVQWPWVILVEIVMSNGHTLLNRREQFPYWSLIQEVSQVSHSFTKFVGYIPVLHCTCEHIHANVFRNVGLRQLWGFVFWKGGWISRRFIFKVEGKTVFSFNAVVSCSCFEKGPPCLLSCVFLNVYD